VSGGGKKALVPRLRFPEFREAGSWEAIQLGKLFSIGSGKDYKHLSAGDIPVYGSGGYMLSVNDFLHDGDSVCIGWKGTIDNPMFLTGKFWTVDTLFFTHSFQRCLPKFIFSVFQNTDWLKHNEAGGVPSLSKANIEKLQTAIPSMLEQQRIADCLTSLDEVIAAQGRKVEALKTYKRGLMQQLFPREGETVPRLRFPEFCDAPEWKQVKAGDLFANRSERGDDTLPVCSVTMTDGLVRRASLYRRIDDLADATGNKKALRFDIAYNMMRMWQGASGVANETCMVSPAYIVLKPQPDVHSPFYGHLFKLPHMLRLFTSHSRGLTEDRLRLYFQDFSNIPMLQPEMREQQQIADFLAAHEARVAAESSRLATLKAHKMGLMQQLFPLAAEA